MMHIQYTAPFIFLICFYSLVRSDMFIMKFNPSHSLLSCYTLPLLLNPYFPTCPLPAPMSFSMYDLLYLIRVACMSMTGSYL